MSLLHYLSILKARRTLILWFVAGSVALVMGVSLMLPRTYNATASLLVDVKLADPVGGVSLGQALLPETLQAYMTTQAEVVSSQHVTQKVIERLRLNENPALRERWAAGGSGKGEFEDWLIQDLRKRLDVRPSRDSTVISITYSDSDSRMAANVANAFAHAYIDTHLELKVQPARRSAAFFDERTKAVREKLAQAQAKLSEFERQSGFVASEDKLDVETARLNELSSQLTAIQAAAAEASYKQNQGSSVSEVNTSPLVQTLRGDLAKSEAKLREMGAQLGTNHPQYQRTEEEVRALRERVALETERASETVRAAARITRQREAQTKAAFEAQRAKVLAMRAARDQAALLVNDLQNAKREHSDLLQRLGQISLEGDMTQTNVSILNRAPQPLYPSSPKLALNLIVSVLLGILGGIGTVFALEALDRRFRDADDLAETLALPVLGVMESTVDIIKSLPKKRPLALPGSGSAVATAES
ncbi:MAG: chain length determinant protein EpsF [Burkholderiales bacterium]|nr:chain length determinant protein EpsF [Burkholderiales bacterium]